MTDHEVKLADIQSLTIRDFFAGMALAGFLASGVSHHSKQDTTKHAYEWADALLEARNPPTRG